MFEFEEYPSHLRDLSVPSYRPVLIQVGGCHSGTECCESMYMQSIVKVHGQTFISDLVILKFMF